MMYELKPIHATTKSFYNKANVVITNEIMTLMSYTTEVAIFNDKTKSFEILIDYDKATNTTMKHIKEFALQKGLVANNKKQMFEDYYKN